jgi:aminomethyltransferase
VLVGLVSEGRRAGRAGYEVFDGDERVGVITSGALSPTLGHPIAMALVTPRVAAPGAVCLRHGPIVCGAAPHAGGAS